LFAQRFLCSISKTTIIAYQVKTANQNYLLNTAPHTPRMGAKSYKSCTDKSPSGGFRGLYGANLIITLKKGYDNFMKGNKKV